MSEEEYFKVKNNIAFDRNAPRKLDSFHKQFLVENKISEDDLEEGNKKFYTNYDGSGVDDVGDRYVIGIGLVDDPFINMISKIDEFITGDYMFYIETVSQM